MKSYEIAQGPKPCPITPLWADIYERGDRAAAERLHEHLQTCSSCRREVRRLNEVEANKPSVLGEIAKNMLVGLAAMTAMALFQSGEKQRR